MSHTYTYYTYLCVCVCIVYHSWRIPRLGADVVWQAVVNRNSQWRLSVAFTIYCTCIWLRSSLNPPGNWLRAGAIWPLWVAAAIALSSSSPPTPSSTAASTFKYSIPTRNPRFRLLSSLLLLLQYFLFVFLNELTQEPEQRMHKLLHQTWLSWF